MTYPVRPEPVEGSRSFPQKPLLHKAGGAGFEQGNSGLMKGQFHRSGDSLALEASAKHTIQCSNRHNWNIQIPRSVLKILLMTIPPLLKEFHIWPGPPSTVVLYPTVIAPTEIPHAQSCPLPSEHQKEPSTLGE